MSNVEPSGGRSRPRRRGRRRSRQNREPQSFPSKGEATAKDEATSDIEQLPPKKVFIYTYTIYKGG